MKPGFRDNAPLRRAIETQSARLITEALIVEASDVRQTQGAWDAGTKTTVTSYADGRLALTPAATSAIAQTSGSDNITDLDDTSPWTYVGCEFGGSLFGENPTLRKVEFYLDIQPNSGTPPFDGEFVVEACRIARLAYSIPDLSDVVALQVVAEALRVKAPELASLTGYVPFVFPDSPFAWAAQAPVIDRSFVPTSAIPATLYPGEARPVSAFLLATDRMVVFVLRAVGGTNTNYALKKDAGAANPYTAGGNGLRYATVATAAYWGRLGRYGGKVTAGTGCPRMKVYADSYPATGSVVITGYDLGAAPAGTLEFRVTDNVPAGTTGQAYVRVPAGPGAWIAFDDGDSPADIGIASQQTYDFKYEMAADSTLTATPELWALGVVDLTTKDLTEIATWSEYEESVDLLSGQTKMAEAELTLQLTGIRDYRDLVTTLMSEYHPTELQIRSFVGGGGLTRAQYGHLETWDVDDVLPGPSSVTLVLVSLLNRLKGRFPRAAGTQTGYLLKAAASDLTGGADWTKELSLETETSGTLSCTIAASSTEVQYATTPATVPGLVRWPTGDWAIAVEVTTGNSNIYLGLRLVRTNASGTLQERRPDRSTIATAEEQQCTAGVKAFTFSVLSWTEGASAGTDRLRVEFYFRNAAGTSQAVTIRTGTTNTEVRPPWVQTTTIAPQVFDNVYPGGAYTTWRDTVIGLPSRFRGAVPDTNRHRVSKAVMDADGQRELERIAWLDGCAITAAQGMIKAVNLWGPRKRVVAVFSAEIATVQVARGFTDRLPEYACEYGYEAQKPRTFAGEVKAQHVASYAALGPSRIGTEDPRVEGETARWVKDPALAAEITRAIVLSCGAGRMSADIVPIEWHPELELGDTVAIETDQWMLLDPATSTPIRGWVWAIGTIVRVRGWTRSGVGVHIAGLADLFATSATVQQRLPYEGPLVTAVVSPVPGDLRKVTVVARCSSLTATMYYCLHDDATAPPGRDRHEEWTAYTGALTVLRDAAAYILLSFFARDGGFSGALATYRIAPDATATIATVTGSEAGASPAITVTWTTSGIDADTRRIRWYMRKHATSYPTVDGTAGGVLNETYFVAETAIAADAGGTLSQAHTGTSYATADKSQLIAVPLDYNGNPGDRKSGSYTVAGTATRAPSAPTWAINTAGGGGVSRTYDFSWGAGTMSASDDLRILISIDRGTPTTFVEETADPTATTSKSNVDSTLVPTSGKYDPWVLLQFFWELRDSGGTLINAGAVAVAAGDSFQMLP